VGNLGMSKTHKSNNEEAEIMKNFFFDGKKKEMRNEANWQNAKWRRSMNTEDIKDTPPTTTRGSDVTSRTRCRLVVIVYL